jgi:hypothetical protein
MAVPYEVTTFPSSLDNFLEVQDGQSPANLVRAQHLNKVNNALLAIERETQYTALTASATGSLLYVAQTQIRLASTLPEPGLTLSIPFTVDSGVANAYFEGNPFDRRWGVMCSAIGYKVAAGTRTYHYTRCGVNCPQELGSLTCYVNVLKRFRWTAGEYVEATLTVIRP